MKYAEIEKGIRGNISVSVWIDRKYIGALYGTDYEIRWDALFENYRIDTVCGLNFLSGTVRVDDYVCLTHKKLICNA